MTKPELAYFAGIIDGEGSIAISKSGGRYDARLYVVNTRPELIKWIKDRFGGLSYVRPDKNGKWRTRYQWAMALNPRNGILLEQLVPFLVIKGGHAKNALLFIKTMKGRGVRVTEEIKAEREKLYIANKELTNNFPAFND